MTNAYAYFGIRGKNTNVWLHHKKEDIELLKDQGMADQDLEHSIQVAKKGAITTQRYYGYHDEIQSLMR